MLTFLGSRSYIRQRRGEITGIKRRGVRQQPAMIGEQRKSEVLELGIETGGGFRIFAEVTVHTHIHPKPRVSPHIENLQTHQFN